jgi:hypothetical protein
MPTVKELRAETTRLNIAGRSKLKKKELEAAIKKAVNFILRLINANCKRITRRSDTSKHCRSLQIKEKGARKLPLKRQKSEPKRSRQGEPNLSYGKPLNSSGKIVKT